MAPPEEQLREIANNAEQDVNTYQAKTGAARGRDIDEAGVDTRVEKHFEGAHVSYEPDQVTNASYDRRIPPEEGGDTDHRGRLATGRYYEGPGGPETKAQLKARDRGGDNDNDVVSESVLDVEDTGKRRGGYNEAYDQGADATRSNVGRNPPGVGGSHFRGGEWDRPERVPDQGADMGNIPPENQRQNTKS
ncbi:hypothetical protein NKR19_g7198 [Coniochaeta hoffmannii]|uniref:Uncharacterized protein n=1 Tax=Coniochaeta hoffmannii TaxID=91930 RepID=A0AA38VN80_9PEZI|nr:hypothetical protein NKR19_g7198 [Coniochaeta hoffmannii]